MAKLTKAAGRKRLKEMVGKAKMLFLNTLCTTTQGLESLPGFEESEDLKRYCESDRHSEG